MSNHYCNFDHKEWDDAGLKDYADFVDCVTFFNQSDYGDGCLEGEWFYDDADTLTIYYGSFGNYNSPGASNYTYADVYGADEKAEFALEVQRLQALPEYVETEEEEEEEEEPTDDEPEEGDYITTDYQTFYQYGRSVVKTDSAGWTVAVKQHMDEEQFWPNVWFQGERGGYDLLSLETGGFAQ
jgi:hypothetical protein